MLEAIHLFKLILTQERKFIELQARLGQLESDVAARQKLALSRTDIDFVGILSTSWRTMEAWGQWKTPTLSFAFETCFPTYGGLSQPQRALERAVVATFSEPSFVGISGRGANLLGVPQLQAVGTLEVLGLNKRLRDQLVSCTMSIRHLGRWLNWESTAFARQGLWVRVPYAPLQVDSG